MFIVWDSLAQLIENEENITAIIEIITIIAAFSAILVLIYIKKKYNKLTKKGFTELIIGFIVFMGHFIFDLLDTLVTKKIDGETVLAYNVFDILDAVLSFVGLFIIGYAFLKIGKYGTSLWEGRK